MTMKQPLVILVTGCSSGFGMLTAARLAAAGHRVHATMRNLEKRDLLEAEALRRGGSHNLRLRQMDVADVTSVRRAVNEILAEDGYIDVLINNAGYGVGGFFEDLSDDDWRQQFDVNFFGVLNVTREVLPSMRPRRKGRIINISSVASFSGTLSFSAYVSTKWALEGFSECLYMELKPFNIDVVLVEPGSYRTKIFGDNARYAKGFNDPNSPYFEMSQYLKAFIAKYIRQSRRDPEEVAVVVEKVVNASEPKFRNIIGWESRLRCWVVRHIPFKLYAALVTSIFAARNKP